jgi:hypothetical protein
MSNASEGKEKRKKKEESDEMMFNSEVTAGRMNLNTFFCRSLSLFVVSEKVGSRWRQQKHIETHELIL